MSPPPLRSTFTSVCGSRVRHVWCPHHVSLADLPWQTVTFVTHFVYHKFYSLSSTHRHYLNTQRESNIENLNNENKHMAGKLMTLQVFHLLSISLVIFFVFSVNVVSEEDYQRAVPPEDKTTTVWFSRIKQSGNDYWAKLKESLGRGHARFFPPNIE